MGTTGVAGQPQTGPSIFPILVGLAPLGNPVALLLGRESVVGCLGVFQGRQGSRARSLGGPASHEGWAAHHLVAKRSLDDLSTRWRSPIVPLRAAAAAS